MQLVPTADFVGAIDGCVIDLDGSANDHKLTSAGIGLPLANSAGRCNSIVPLSTSSEIVRETISSDRGNCGAPRASCHRDLSMERMSAGRPSNRNGNECLSRGQLQRAVAKPMRCKDQSRGNQLSSEVAFDNVRVGQPDLWRGLGGVLCATHDLERIFENLKRLLWSCVHETGKQPLWNSCRLNADLRPQSLLRIGRIGDGYKSTAAR